MKRPLIGMISRMVDQKGFDLIALAADDLLTLDATWVVLGTGEARYQNLWTSIAARRPDRVGVRIGFDEALAHLIEAGADIFLMPSRFEPCGLNQMYSLRYGTVPVVHAVGGLADTVRDYSPRRQMRRASCFEEHYAGGAARDALRGRWRCLRIAPGGPRFGSPGCARIIPGTVRPGSTSKYTSGTGTTP